MKLTKEISEQKLKNSKKGDISSIKIDRDLTLNEKKKLLFDFRWKIEQNFHKNKTMTLIQIDDKT